jgi:ABC-type antimicrobial peptide transport system permease subunit
LILIAIFGGLALALAAGGVYGVVSYVVEQRTREMGLRLALGATPAVVSWMILRQTLAIGSVGAATGVLAWAALTHTVSTLLFGISRLDARTIAEVLLILLAAALTASCVPVLRAGRVDPAVALRAE